VSSLTPPERERVLELIDELIVARVEPGPAATLRKTIDDHLAAAGDYLLGGVNPARDDGDPAWDDARWAAIAPTVNVGAVHLELGTFTAFGDERVREFVVNDGLSEFIRLDFDRQYKPDLVADVTMLPLAGGSVDRVVSNSLFEHVAYPHRIIEESYRVLRPGGVMVVVMPFMFPRHGYPHDYVRLTPQFFERVCRETGFTQIVVDDDASSGLYNTLHNASKMAAVAHGRPESDAMRAIHEAVILLLGALIPADRWFENSSRQWFHSVRVVATKPGAYDPSRRARDESKPLIARIADLLADPQTKAPLRYDGRRLVSEFSGFSYRVEDGIAVFTEPRQLEPRKDPAPAVWLRPAAGAARRRARS
jgi:SAM-dependent methyltransferase